MGWAGRWNCPETKRLASRSYGRPRDKAQIDRGLLDEGAGKRALARAGLQSRKSRFRWAQCCRPPEVILKSPYYKSFSAPPRAAAWNQKKTSTRVSAICLDLGMTVIRGAIAFFPGASKRPCALLTTAYEHGASLSLGTLLRPLRLDHCFW